MTSNGVRVGQAHNGQGTQWLYDLSKRRWRHRAAWLAVLGGMVACGAPHEPSEPPPPAVLRILGEPHVSLKVGTTTQLSVVAQDARGAEVPVVGTWSSSDTSVARVDTPGVVRAVGYGEASIAVHHGGGRATVLVSATPSGLRIRPLPGDMTVEEGDSYVVVAEFLDERGDVIVVPFDVFWEVSAGASLIPGGTKQTQLLRELPAGVVEVVATSGPFRASLRLTVRPGGEPKLRVPHFTLWTDALPGGRMAFYPDLVVISPFDATIVRLEFSGNPRSLCATVRAAPGVVTPLFDFVPYDVSWQDEAIPRGSAVEAFITIRRADGSQQTVHALGLVTALDRRVIDYGTGSYAWGPC